MLRRASATGGLRDGLDGLLNAGPKEFLVLQPKRREVLVDRLLHRVAIADRVLVGQKERTWDACLLRKLGDALASGALSFANFDESGHIGVYQDVNVTCFGVGARKETAPWAARRPLAQSELAPCAGGRLLGVRDSGWWWLRRGRFAGLALRTRVQDFGKVEAADSAGDEIILIQCVAVGARRASLPVIVPATGAVDEPGSEFARWVWALGFPLYEGGEQVAAVAAENLDAVGRAAVGAGVLRCLIISTAARAAGIGGGCHGRVRPIWRSGRDRGLGG